MECRCVKRAEMKIEYHSLKNSRLFQEVLQESLPRMTPYNSLCSSIVVAFMTSFLWTGPMFMPEYGICDCFKNSSKASSEPKIISFRFKSHVETAFSRIHKTNSADFVFVFRSWKWWGWRIYDEKLARRKIMIALLSIKSTFRIYSVSASRPA